MDSINLNIDELIRSLSYIDRASGNISSVRSGLSNLLTQIDKSILTKNDINSQINNILKLLSNIDSNLSSIKALTKKASTDYLNVEAYLKRNAILLINKYK